MQKRIWIVAALLVIGSGLNGCVEVYTPLPDWTQHGEYSGHGSDGGGYRQGD